MPIKAGTGITIGYPKPEYFHFGEVGKINMDTGEFEGKADEAAKVFWGFIKQFFDESKE